MPFSTTGSVISTDLDNMLRGIGKDNADHSLTGGTGETTLASVSILGSSIGATGGLHVIACGTLSGTLGTKTLRLKYGTTTLATITQAAGTTSDWFFDAWIMNTSVSAQRVSVQRNGNDVLTSSYDYATSAEDTSATKSVFVTGQLGNAGDTITQTLMDVFVVQIT